MAFRTAVVALGSLGLAAAYNNGMGRTPALGWNTWCSINTCGFDLCFEDEIKAIAEAMVANGMRDLGYTRLNLDDCYASNRTASGELTWDTDRFPNGLPALISYVNSLGFEFGVYTDSGLYTCSKGGRSYPIPGSYGHYQQDANSFASWGVQYVKMDWCNTVVNGTQLDPHVVYHNMSVALNATGKPIWFESCEWGVDQPWTWAGQYMNSWRIGGDHHDTFSGPVPATEGVIELFAGLSSYGGPFGWNYGDFIYTRGQGCTGQTQLGAHCPGQSDQEYITEFTMWVIAASPIIVATNVANMTDIMKTVLLNKDMIAVHQDPLGIPGDRIGYDTTCPTNMCQLWARPLANGDSAAVLYNRDGAAAHNVTLTFSAVNSTFTGSVYVYDLWQQQTKGAFSGSYSVVVPPHGVAAVRLSTN